MSPISPDCAYGKHRACHGDAWDAAADAVTGCTCSCHELVALAGSAGVCVIGARLVSRRSPLDPDWVQSACDAWNRDEPLEDDE